MDSRAQELGVSKLVLANIDYEKHSTNEGNELQLGLSEAGWRLAGFGYGDGCVDVPALIERHSPHMVFVQDCRDWRWDSGGCFDQRVAFKNWESLGDCKAFKVTPVKDAGSVVEYQRKFFEKIKADAAMIYYHPDAVLKLSPWLEGRKLIRTYHSVDSRACEAIGMKKDRRRGLVSGAVSDVYPLRQMAIKNAGPLGLDYMPHPGYGNSGSHTGKYLELLAGYKVHVATASKYHFALRKIIESVAMGCAPVTNLPEWDRLPGIDAALIRVPDGISSADLNDVVSQAEKSWDYEERMAYANVARQFYDYRAAGQRLDAAIQDAYFEARIPADSFWMGVHCLNNSMPWFVPESARYLGTELRENDSVFEVGSGGSTLFFSDHCSSVFAVETSQSWAVNVRCALHERKVKNCDLEVRETQESVEQCIQDMEDNQFTVISVDSMSGYDRSRFLNLLLNKNAQSVRMVILDNYSDKTLFLTPHMLDGLVAGGAVDGWEARRFDSSRWFGSGTLVAKRIR